MNENALVPTTHAISENCPKFRLLVVGASGVGKSSLLNAAFGLDLQVHSDRAGVCDINQGIESRQNRSFVVHDSQGYAPGEKDNYDTVQRFIADMETHDRVADKLHAIWLCIETPSASTLVLQKGAENMLLSHGNVPLIVVFMQYDKFLMTYADKLNRDPASSSLSDEEFEIKAEELADSQYRSQCINCLKDFASTNSITPPRCVRVSSFPNFENTVSELIQLTYQEVAKDVAATLATAQRSDAETKVKASIEIGRKEYWLGLASVTGTSLKRRLRVIHTDIVNTWFKDEATLLNSGNLIATLVDAPESRKGKQILLGPLGIAGPVAGITGAVSGPAAPITVPAVFVGVLVISWLHEVNANTPIVLRRIMAYVVHLVNVMRGLFGRNLRSGITEDQVKTVVELYRSTSTKKDIDRDVENFTMKKAMWDAGRDTVFEEITRLIKQHTFEEDMARN